MLRKKLFFSIMVFSVLFSFTSVISVEASSTVLNQVYEKSGSDWGTCVVETSDGGYAIAGVTYAFNEENHAFWLVKTDAYGNMEWDKTYAAPNDFFFVHALIETSDGGYAMVSNGISLTYGGLLIKTDSFGNVEWSKTYDRVCHAIVEASDGGYMLAGGSKPVRISSSGAANMDDYDANDFWLAKTDSTGTLQWSKTYGGSEKDVAYALIETSDGGYALGGYTDSFGAEDTDFWLVKTDSSGNEQWNQKHDVTLPSMFFHLTPFSLVEASDGGYAIAGPTSGPPDDTKSDLYLVDFCLIKTDSSGTLEWNQTYGGPDRDWPTAMVALPDGGFVIAGDTESSGAGEFDFWLVRTDRFGTMKWKQTYGGTGYDFVYSMVATSDGEYAVAGRTTSFGGDDGITFWLVKTGGCLETHEFQTYEFDYSYGYGTYVVVISTNSTIGGFDFGINQNQISFAVTGPTGTTGFTRIIIPEDLTSGNLPVYLNELLLIEDADYTKTYNGSHTIFDLTYSHSTHLIEITGTNVIVPELQSWLLLPLLTIAALIFALYQKKHST